MRYLSICHNIFTEEKDGDIIFNSSSPDEIALANFAKMLGFEFRGMTPDNKLVLRHKGIDQYIKVLYILEFTSKRKR